MSEKLPTLSELLMMPTGLQPGEHVVIVDTPEFKMGVGVNHKGQNFISGLNMCRFEFQRNLRG